MRDPGVYSWRELQRAGVTQAQIRHALSQGDLVRLRRGWYASTTADPSVRTAVERGGVLSCISALRWHGVWVPEHHREIHCRANSNRRRNGFSYCSRHGRPEIEVAAIDDLPTALRYAVRCLDGEGIVVVCDSLLNSGRMTSHEIDHVLAGCPPSVRRLLDRCDGRAQSGTETMARLRLRALRIPVRPQVRLPRIGKVDLLVGRRLIVEVDGEEFHGSTDGFANDRRRDREAIAQGYLPLRFTYHDVVHDWQPSEDLIVRLVRDRRHREPRHKRHR